MPAPTTTVIEPTDGNISQPPLMLITDSRQTQSSQLRDRSTTPPDNSPWLRRNWRAIYVMTNIIVDTLMIVAAGFTAYAIRQLLPVPVMTFASAARIVLYSAASGIVLALLCGVYRSSYRIPFTEQYRLAGRVYVYFAFITIGGLFIAYGRDIPPRFAAFFLLLVPVYFVAGRTALNSVNRFFQEKGFGRHNSMIVNSDDSLSNLPYRFALFPELGYMVKAFACESRNGNTCNPRTCSLQRDFAQLRMFRKEPTQDYLPCYSFDHLKKGIEKENIERLFVPLARPLVKGFADIVRACLETKVKLKVISHESQELLRFSQVKDIVGISLYSPPRMLMERIKARIKRLFDVAGSVILILCLSPLFVVISVAILIEDGLPVFFVQRRSSVQGGKTFDILKFRSMVKGAEEGQDVFNRANEMEGGKHLLKSDPRITRVGRLIRKFSADELPQLWNVLKGEMSLVGPRPLSLHDLQNISPDNDFAGYFYLRANTKPGMTGLSQICGRRNVLFRETVLLDLYYIENQSIIFDLEILFATLPVVVFGHGAY